MGIQIIGLEQVQRRLRQAPKILVLRAFAIALDRAAGVIAADVDRGAEALPESGSSTPLADHIVINIEVDPNGRGAEAAIGFDSSVDERTGIPQDLKALLVEYGHRIVTHKPGLKDIGEVKGDPFIRRAFEAKADRAIEVFAETLIDKLSVIEEME